MVFILFTQCVDRIEVDTSTEPERIAIDGFITNESKIHQVRIMRTVKFSNELNKPVSGAFVQIESSDDQVIDLEEHEPGIYKTTCCFKADKDISYKLVVRFDGKIIESNEQVLPNYSPVTGVKYRSETKKIFRKVDQEVVDEPGIVVSTYLTPTEGNHSYFFWQLIPTFIWDATRAQSELVKRCWVTVPARFQSILIHKERKGGYNKDLAFIIANREMEIKYGLEVIQYNINEDAYLFWDRIKKQKENAGSIFDSPPSSIQGNLYNTDNQKDIILGYFGVYNESVQRIFLSNDDLPYNFDFVDICERLFRGRPYECVNCLRYPGGSSSTQKPEWWED